MLEDLKVTKILAVIKKWLPLPWNTEECPVKEQYVAEPREENKKKDRVVATLNTIQEEKTAIIEKQKREKIPIIKIRTSTKPLKVSKLYVGVLIVSCITGLISAQPQTTKGEMTGSKQVNGDLYIKCAFHIQCRTTSWVVTNLGNVSRTVLVAREDSIQSNPKEYSVTLTKEKTFTVYVLKIKKAYVNYADRVYKCNCHFDHIEKNIRDITFTQTSSGGPSSSRAQRYGWLVIVVILIFQFMC